MSAPGAVVDVAGLGLPGDVYTLALAPLDRPEFDALVHAHPAPPGEDRLFDLDTLSPALIAACAVAPTLTVDEATALFDGDDWPDAQAIADLCFDLCLPKSTDRAWWRLEREAPLAEEMAYCGPRGIPHSHFLGGPLAWSDVDRDLALAWEARRRATCQGCGLRRDQWTNADGRFDPQAFEVDFDDCPGCWLLMTGRKKLEGDAAQHIHVHLARATDDDEDDDGGEPA